MFQAIGVWRYSKSWSCRKAHGITCTYLVYYHSINWYGQNNITDNVWILWIRSPISLRRHLLEKRIPTSQIDQTKSQAAPLRPRSGPRMANCSPKSKRIHAKVTTYHTPLAGPEFTKNTNPSGRIHHLGDLLWQHLSSQLQRGTWNQKNTATFTWEEGS